MTRVVKKYTLPVELNSVTTLDVVQNSNFLSVVEEDVENVAVFLEEDPSYEHKELRHFVLFDVDTDVRMHCLEDEYVTFRGSVRMFDGRVIHLYERA